jgi:hypothetical protein
VCGVVAVVGEVEDCVVGVDPVDGEVVCAVANAVPTPKAPPNTIAPTTTRPVRLVMRITPFSRHDSHGAT